VKKRVFEIIEKADDNDRLSKLFDFIILFLIVLTVIAVILESYEFLSVKYEQAFEVFEIISIIVFTIEYILRVWTADIKYSSYNKVISRIRFIFSFMALIDLFAILPFYLPMILPFDLRFLRIVRITRLFRIFKLNRYSKALNLIGKVLKEKKEELFATIFIMFFIILISSTLIYYIEYDVQPEAFPNIIASFWWAIATLTTVGYGDIYPVTALGKILSSVIAVAGIGLVALPTGIISSGFMNEIKSETKHKCPKCGNIFKD
jgi:voltage-gated potassium channel